MGDLEGAQHALGEELVRLEPGDVLAVEIDLSRRWLVDAGDDVEEGGLARAIGPDESGDGAALDDEGRAIHGPDAAEAHVQVFNGDHGHRRPARRVFC